MSDNPSTHPPCYKVWDRLWYCGSPAGQFRNIYRFGEIEDCQPYWDDWKNCMAAKVYQDKNEKQVSIFLCLSPFLTHTQLIYTIYLRPFAPLILLSHAFIVTPLLPYPSYSCLNTRFR